MIGLDRIKRRIIRFKLEETGTAIVEMVLMTPIMVYGFLITLQFFDAYRAELISSKAALTIADMYSRETGYIDPTYLNGTRSLLKYLTLAENDPIVPKQTSYARVVSGEIPILFDYDFNAYRGKYEEDGNFEFVLPCEGSVRVPYVMSLVADAPNPDAGKRVLDFILSDEGQAIWTNAYLQPARPVELPAEVAEKFLPASDYERAVAVDYAEMERAQAAFGERYLNEVK